MARGRKTAFHIRLTSADRQTLRSWQRSTTLPAGRARRGRIILQLADGVPVSHIATTVGISRRFVYKWVQRSCRTASTGWRTKRDAGTGDWPAPTMGGLPGASSWAEGGMESATGVPARRHALPNATWLAYGSITTTSMGRDRPSRFQDRLG